MTRDEFIGYLHALKDINDNFDCLTIEDVLYLVIEKVKILEVFETTSYPTFPVYPPQTFVWSEDTLYDWNTKSDITDAFSYMGKFPDSHKWSVKKDPKLPDNWKIIK